MKISDVFVCLHSGFHGSRVIFSTPTKAALSCLKQNLVARAFQSRFSVHSHGYCKCELTGYNLKWPLVDVLFSDIRCGHRCAFREMTEFRARAELWWSSPVQLCFWTVQWKDMRLGREGDAQNSGSGCVPPGLLRMSTAPSTISALKRDKKQTHHAANISMLFHSDLFPAECK